MSKFKYYADKAKGQAPAPSKTVHTDFLRTGKIARAPENWVAEEKRYLTAEEVAERTGKRLDDAGRKTHKRLNSFHRKIQFPEIIFHKTLAQAPHLGYVHVTASKNDIDEHKGVTWGFYLANFAAEINSDMKEGEQFFHHVKPGYARMYFAIAMKNGEDGKSRKQVINTGIRDHGVLFKTDDPKLAMKNVLMLGARDAELKKIIEAIG